MKFYDEEKLLKIRNILIVAVLMLLTILLFFRVYDNFAKPIRLVTSTIFPFILSFVIVYCLMPFIDMISEKDRIKNSKLDELEKVEKMNISNSERRKRMELFNKISHENKKKKNSVKPYICNFTCINYVFYNFSLYSFNDCSDIYKASIKPY